MITGLFLFCHRTVESGQNIFCTSKSYKFCAQEAQLIFILQRSIFGSKASATKTRRLRHSKNASRLQTGQKQARESKIEREIVLYGSMANLIGTRTTDMLASQQKVDTSAGSAWPLLVSLLETVRPSLQLTSIADLFAGVLARRYVLSNLPWGWSTLTWVTL